MIELKSLLENSGLTDGEARVYLSLIELGKSTVGPIASKSGVAYSKVYGILDRLQEKGLVSTIKESKTNHHQALSAQRILDYLERQRSTLEEQQEKVKQVLPIFHHMANTTTTDPKAELFTGMKGLKTAHEMLVSPDSELLFFYAASEDIDPKVGAFFSSLDPLYQEQKVRLRGIVPGKYVQSPHFTNTKGLYKVKTTSFPVPNNIAVCEDKLLLSSWRTPVGVLIVSEEMAQQFRMFFKSVWRAS